MSIDRQAELRAFALTLPEAHQESHHGRPDLRVRNKIFATLPPDGSLVLKTTPANLQALCSADPETFTKVWGERWVGVDLSGAHVDRVRDLVVDAWKLAAPKTLVRAFESAAN